MAGRQSPDEFAALQASVTTFHATIAEHTKTRELHRTQRTRLDADLKLLAEKKTAYARLLQQQQTLQRERDTDTAQAKNLEASLALLAEEEASTTGSKRPPAPMRKSGSGWTGSGRRGLIISGSRQNSGLPRGRLPTLQPGSGNSGH